MAPHVRRPNRWREVARFPQSAVLAVRRSILDQAGRPTREALRQGWANGLEATFDEACGANRFASGKGRHSDFSDI